MHTPPKKLHWYTLAKGDEYRNPSANSRGPFVTWGELPERGVTQSVAYVPESQWLPIETAPKDGTGILAFTAEGQCEVSRIRGKWIQSPCYSTYDGCGSAVLYCEPSHWMPLPEAPKC